MGKVMGLIGTIRDVIEFVKVQEQARSQLLQL
nr:MAG TPA: aureochrome1-like protein [Caudoviricetes sp.]DAX74406.1 MAG TPA: aureochrome1-like protein [Caudoviricetes sp.]